MKICFMGSSIFARIICEYLLNKNIQIDCIYTQAPKPKGRGKHLELTDLHSMALKYNIPVETPANFKEEATKTTFKNYNFDLALVASYGIILPQFILDCPTYGCINVHGSILPKYRGASPIQMALHNGEKTTGITIMQMDKGMDSGDIITTKEININYPIEFNDLYKQLAELSCEALLNTILELKHNGKVNKTPQNHNLATFTKILTKEDGRINFNLHANSIVNKILAFNPFPSTYFYYKEEPIKILQAIAYEKNHNNKIGEVINLNPLTIAVNNSILEIKVLQRAGKNPLNAKDFLNGFKLNIGDILT
jgi:methionyl-tRNA formyltransferase